MINNNETKVYVHPDAINNGVLRPPRLSHIMRLLAKPKDLQDIVNIADCYWSTNTH